ncbi:hypothetical protein MTO96_011815 [Rhipicephalus appendiculatus]
MTPESSFSNGSKCARTWHGTSSATPSQQRRSLDTYASAGVRSVRHAPAKRQRGRTRAVSPRKGGASSAPSRPQTVRPDHRRGSPRTRARSAHCWVRERSNSLVPYFRAPVGRARDHLGFVRAGGVATATYPGPRVPCAVRRAPRPK